MILKLALLRFVLAFLLNLAPMNYCDAQTNNLFLNGIHISEENVTIPWGISFDEIKKLGSPKINCSTKSNTQVEWKSVTILDSTKVDCWTFYYRCFTKRRPLGKLSRIYCAIDSINLPNLISLFDKYANASGKYEAKKREYSYYWIIDDCNVQLGYNTTYNYYLWIQKRKSH